MSDATTICSSCGKPSDGWPDASGGELCQMCWERDCSESWWRMMAALPGDDRGDNDE